MCKNAVLATVMAVALAAGGADRAPAAIDVTAPGSAPTAAKVSTDAVTIPEMLNYQGRLLDANGRPARDSVYAMGFALFDDSIGGSSFWSESKGVETHSGLFSVMLGSVNPIPGLPSDGGCYLEMTVRPQPPLAPRTRIVSAAYAYVARRADTANFAIAGGGGGTVTSVHQGSGIICQPNPITEAGAINIDTSYADARFIRNQFSAVQNGSFRIRGVGAAAQFDAQSTTLGDDAIRGDGQSFGHGVYGVSNCTTYRAVCGVNTHASGTGVVGIGNNVASLTLPGGSGGAFAGKAVGCFGAETDTTVMGGAGVHGWTATHYGVGVAGVNVHSQGTGVTGVNGTTGYSYSGTGGAFTGLTYGVVGYANATSGTRAGGYFRDRGANYAYVCYNDGSTQYKINGTGSVSTVMATRQGRKNLFAPEMPESWFEDVGSAQLAEGHCRVNLEPLFADCIAVSERQPLRVFVQLEDDCRGVYVRPDLTGFDVYELQSGRSSARFAYRVLGKWKGNEQLRFPDAPTPPEARSIEPLPAR